MKLVYIESPTLSEQQYFENKLLRFNESKIEGYSYDGFIYRIDDADRIVAGINCEFGGGWLYIAGLWVSETHRGKGLGDKLLAAAEKKALEENCHGAYLFTYDFQAPEFYQKQGYEIFGKLEKFCNHHEKVYMKKRLV
ncbi:MAG: GNAT family N-acetyltransferase [Desulfobacteraceae bacterium]|nr:MAG: GNAT family N-acetyltransferase [Desulfobacteraceae bacterium]